ncbi:MAG: DUF1670 domain-containing protein [Candidatus Undinarchaeales archaeon]|jgi:hypothetical protein|nr:DUF1670 domain-containing protein [Candidatus Undinarchaeales archaeon]
MVTEMPYLTESTELIDSEYRSIVDKSLKNQIYTMFIEDYQFPRAICRGLTRDILTYLDVYMGGQRSGEQIVFHAVSKDVPAGVKITDARLVAVHLTVLDLEADAATASRSQGDLLKSRIKRLANEAFEQGGLLTQADLALILGESTRTIGRHIREIQKTECITVPTRGTMRDMGSGTSHKAKIVELHLQDYEYSEIELRTKHSPTSIMRYIKDFSRVVILHRGGHTLREIRIITGNSDRVVRDYLELYERYSEDEEMKEKIDRIAASEFGGEKWSPSDTPDPEGKSTFTVPGRSHG